ncbi:MAG: hypothetical protein QM783_06685 [Phycisphaerales bacterium]
MRQITPPPTAPAYESPMFQGGIPMKKIGDRNKEANAFPIQNAPTAPLAADLEQYMDPMPPAAPATTAPVSTPTDITNGESTDPLSFYQDGFDFNALFKLEPTPADVINGSTQAKAAQSIEIPSNGSLTNAPAAPVTQQAAKPATTGKATAAPATGKTAAPATATASGNSVGSFTNGTKPVEQQATVPTETPKP